MYVGLTTYKLTLEHAMNNMDTFWYFIEVIGKFLLGTLSIVMGIVVSLYIIWTYFI